MSLSSLLMHGVLCDTMMVTIIASIIKNKSGDLSDNNNHRPSNLFESLTLSRITIFLATCANITYNVNKSYCMVNNSKPQGKYLLC